MVTKISPPKMRTGSYLGCPVLCDLWPYVLYLVSGMEYVPQMNVPLWEYWLRRGRVLAEEPRGLVTMGDAACAPPIACRSRPPSDLYGCYVVARLSRELVKISESMPQHSRSCKMPKGRYMSSSVGRDRREGGKLHC